MSYCLSLFFSFQNCLNHIWTRILHLPIYSSPGTSTTHLLISGKMVTVPSLMPPCVCSDSWVRSKSESHIKPMHPASYHGKDCTFNQILFSRSLTYTRKSCRPRYHRFNISVIRIRGLNHEFCFLLRRKLSDNFKSLPKTPFCFNLKIKPSCRWMVKVHCTIILNK